MTESAAPLTQPVLRLTPPRGWLDLDLGEVWSARELLYFFVWRDIKIRYKQTAIGVAWAVLQPLLTMLVFSLFFGKLAKIPSEGLPYPVFYYCALLPWTYFATGLQNATNTIVEQQRVITKVYFPRLVLPLAAVLSGLLDFAVSFVVFLAMMVYYRVAPHAAVLLLPGNSRSGGPLVSGFSVAGSIDRARRRTVAVGAERDLPRRAVRAAVSGAVLDVRLPGRLSEQPGSRALALAVWPEPHGWSH